MFLTSKEDLTNHLVPTKLPSVTYRDKASASNMKFIVVVMLGTGKLYPVAVKLFKWVYVMQ